MTTTSIDLGGGIRVHPGIMQPELVPAADLTEHPQNPRRGDVDAIGESLDTNGLYDQIKVQRSTGYILAGNHTYRTLTSKGAERVPVVFLDCDDTEALRIMASANATADRGGYDTRALLHILGEDLGGDLTGTGYEADEYALLVRAAEGDGPVYVGDDALHDLRVWADSIPGDESGDGEDGDRYTKRVDPIHYEPTQEAPPPVESLVDSAKADALLADIQAADLPEDVAAFLTAGAQRHLVFNYAQIAEYYAHATPEVQRLMEASALVLIDFQDAISHGYVRLSARLAELLDVDLEYRAGLDQRSDSLRDPQAVPDA